MRRVLKNFFVFGLIFLTVLLGGAVLLVQLGQKHIIALFVRAANQHLATPVRVGKIELSLLDQFPRVSITLHQVTITGSLPADTTALARLQTLYCAFDAWDMLAGRYRVRALTLRQGRVYVHRNARGVGNYNIFRTDSAQADTGPLRFALEKISLQQVGVVYLDAGLHQRYSLQAHDVQAQLSVAEPEVAIAATGRLRVTAVELGPDAYLRDKELALRTQLTINRQMRLVRIAPSALRIGPAEYQVGGTVAYAGATQLNLTVQGKHTTAQSVVALLPARLVRHLRAYRSEGEVYFGGSVRGELSARANPLVQVRFGCRNASFYHPRYQQRVEQVFLTGSFTNGARHNARTSVLALQGIRGKLQGRPFTVDVRYADFADPHVQAQLRADVDVGQALHFFPVAAIRGGRGQAAVQLVLNGRLRDFQHQLGRAGTATGELQLRGVSLQLRDYAQPISHLSGRLVLRNNLLSLQNCTAQWGRSDFRVNGEVRNPLAWAFTAGQPLVVAGSVASQRLYLDELLPTAAPSAGRPAGGAAASLVPALLGLDIAATARQVHFRRLHGRNLQGIIRLQRQVFSSPGLSLEALGGRAGVRGTFDVRQPTLLKASTVASCSGMPLDSLFYVFEDFGQRFITHHQLRGVLTASGESDVYFNEHLEPITDRLEAEIRATVRHGELNNFAPAQKLAMVASREQLRHLRFAELTNNFYIQSRTVYLPEMEIRSNVRTASLIRVTGTHTFDQQMDYHLTIPLLPGLLRRVSIGSETAAGPAIFLAVRGDEDNFRVTFDQRRPGEANAGPPAARAKPRLAEILAGRPTAQAPTAGSGAEEKPAAHRPVFKPEPKKPVSPQPGEYFDF